MQEELKPWEQGSKNLSAIDIPRILQATKTEYKSRKTRTQSVLDVHHRHQRAKRRDQWKPSWPTERKSQRPKGE